MISFLYNLSNYLLRAESLQTNLQILLGILMENHDNLKKLHSFSTREHVQLCEMFLIMNTERTFQ